MPARCLEKNPVSRRTPRVRRRLPGSLAVVLFLLLFAGVCGDPYEPITSVALEILAGNGQSAQSGVAVSTRPQVRVTSANGRGVPDQPLTFVVTGGNGTVTGGSGATGADGTFAVGSWVLGAVGTNTLVAQSGGLSVLFTATATAGRQAAITR
jgi:hypothetical protein